MVFGKNGRERKSTTQQETVPAGSRQVDFIINISNKFRNTPTRRSVRPCY